MLLNAVHALFGLLVLALAAYGSGNPLLRGMPASLREWEKAIFSLAGGWGLLSLLLYLIGQVRFSRSIIVSLVALLAIVGLIALGKQLRARRWTWSFSDSRLYIPAVTVLLLFQVSTIAGFAEVTGGWESDTVAYHLLGPKVWLHTGLIRSVPDNSPTAFPQTAETMFAALMVLGGPSGPGISSLLTFGLLLGVAASLGMRCGLDAAGGWWVAAIVGAMPAVFTGSHAGFVDGLYATFFLIAVRLGLEVESRAEWAVFGLFCGLVVGTKYTGLLAVPILFACVLFFRGWKGQRLVRSDWSNVITAVAAATIVSVPYYIRNWALLGCPIYPPPPALFSFCHPKYLPLKAILNLQQYIVQRGAGMGRGPVGFLLLPFHLTYNTANFHGAGGIGLVPLGLGPIGIFALRKNRFAQFLVSMGFLLTVAWFVTQQESRFLIHVYVLAAVFGVVAWRTSPFVRIPLARVVAALLVAVSLGYGALMIFKLEEDAIHAVFSPSYAARRHVAEIPFEQSFAYINQNPLARKILILDRSVPPFYLDKDYAKPFGQWGELTLPGIESSSQAVGQVHQLGFTHIMDVHSGVGDFQVVPGTPGLALEFEAENQRVYRVE
jgi:hypothetical protein